MAYTVRATREEEAIIKKVAEYMGRKGASKVMLAAVYEYIALNEMIKKQKEKILNLELEIKNKNEKIQNFSIAFNELFIK